MNTAESQLRIQEALLYSYARYFPIRRGKLRLINAMWHRVVPKNKTIRIAQLKFGKFAMLCDLSQYLQRQFYFFGTYLVEETVLERWSEFARNASIVFDVGANAGIYSLAAKAARPTAIVNAFEPTPEIAARFRETVQRNNLRNVTIHELAVGRRTGSAYLHLCKGATGANDGMNYITDGAESGTAIKVPLTTIDVFCSKKKIPHIDLLKLDVQGFEADALVGAQELLHEGRIDTVFTELNWGATSGCTSPGKETLQLLTHHGFSFAEPNNPRVFRSAGDWVMSCTEIIAKRHNR